MPYLLIVNQNAMRFWPYSLTKLWAVLMASALLSMFSHASELASAPGSTEFNRDIRPILSDKCFTCHGPDKANRVTELRFDTEAGTKIALSGGRQVLVPGSPEQSELYRRIASNDEAVRMPPAAMGHAKLSSAEIDLVRRWIEQGAKWQGHWSFIPPKRPELPDRKSVV